MSKTPGRVWRGAPSMGQDTENILKTILGYDSPVYCRRRGLFPASKSLAPENPPVACVCPG